MRFSAERLNFAQNQRLRLLLRILHVEPNGVSHHHGRQAVHIGSGGQAQRPRFVLRKVVEAGGLFKQLGRKGVVSRKALAAAPALNEQIPEELGLLPGEVDIPAAAGE